MRYQFSVSSSIFKLWVLKLITKPHLDDQRQIRALLLGSRITPCFERFHYLSGRRIGFKWNATLFASGLKFGGLNYLTRRHWNSPCHSGHTMGLPHPILLTSLKNQSAVVRSRNQCKLETSEWKGVCSAKGRKWIHGFNYPIIAVTFRVTFEL